MQMQPRSGFELGLSCSEPKTISVTVEIRLFLESIALKWDKWIIDIAFWIWTVIIWPSGLGL